MSLYISPSLVAGAGTSGQPLNLARIGYRNIVFDATVTASSDTSASPAMAIKNPMTYDRWQPSNSESDGWLEIVPDGGSVVVDYIALASHNLGSAGAEVVIEYKEAGTPNWHEVNRVLPANDNAMMFLFEQVEADAFRISIDKNAYISVVYIGKALVMPRCIYGGHSPVTLSRDTTFHPNKSIEGAFVGRSIVRQGLKTRYDWNNLEPDWYRRSFDPFVMWATKYPFFIAWYPERWPDEVAYCWTNDDIRPVNTGVRDFMRVGFDVEGVD